MTRKQIEINDRSINICTNSKNNEFTTNVLRSNLCDFNDLCMVVKGTAIGMAGYSVIFKNVFTGF